MDLKPKALNLNAHYKPCKPKNMTFELKSLKKQLVHCNFEVQSFL